MILKTYTEEKYNDNKIELTVTDLKLLNDKILKPLKLDIDIK